jgi:hypothetical protein
MEPRQEEPLSLVHKYKTRMEVTEGDKPKITKLIYDRKNIFSIRHRSTHATANIFKAELELFPFSLTTLSQNTIFSKI